MLVTALKVSFYLIAMYVSLETNTFHPLLSEQVGTLHKLHLSGFDVNVFPLVRSLTNLRVLQLFSCLNSILIIIESDKFATFAPENWTVW